MSLPILRLVNPLPVKLLQCLQTACIISHSLEWMSFGHPCLISSVGSVKRMGPMHTMYGIVYRACLPPCVQRLE